VTDEVDTVDPEPDELRQCLLEFFDDVADLEILARLRELRPARALNEVEIATLTRFPSDGTREALLRLVARGLLRASEDSTRYLYSIEDPTVRGRVENLLDTYRGDPLHVMNLLTANAMERVKSAAILAFADCFRIRSPKSDG
jgi:hypothetical protein